jgi:hypothetical protein
MYKRQAAEILFCLGTSAACVVIQVSDYDFNWTDTILQSSSYVSGLPQ